MNGLPKKYAKMGFSKGWKAYKATKKGGNMAKRKTRRSGVKRSYKRAHSKQMKVLGIDVMEDMVLPGAYGYGREILAEKTLPFTRQIPGVAQLGTLGDNAGMIGVNWLGAKLTSKWKPVQKIFRNGIRIEAAQMGQEIRAGGLGIGGSAGGSSQQSFR